MPGTVPDFGYTAARIWLRLDVTNATADLDDWRFFVQANFTQQNGWRRSKSGTST
jgi:hypothetical protein